MTKAKSPAVYVCTGSDCAKDKRKLRSLIKTLGVRTKVKQVKCQKFCDGPVAGVTINGTLTWFTRLTGHKHRESLLHLLDSGKTDKTLQKHRRKKRRGKLR